MWEQYGYTHELACRRDLQRPGYHKDGDVPRARYEDITSGAVSPRVNRLANHGRPRVYLSSDSVVHNHGFALVRQFLTILSRRRPSSLAADRATVRFGGIYPSAAYVRSWPGQRPTRT
jgi:hypothetical protein